MYIHVILAPGVLSIFPVLTALRFGVVELGFISGCIMPPNYIYFLFWRVLIELPEVHVVLSDVL